MPLDRILRVFRANLNHWVNQAEDPEKILEVTLFSLQDDLIQLRQAVAGAIATQKRLERQRNQHEEAAQVYKQRAQLALKQNNEALARQLLTQRQPCLDTSRALHQQIEQSAAIVSKLKRDMQTLEQKLMTAKAKRDLYVARARSAQASQKLHEMLGTLSDHSAFNRLEQKVQQLEAYAEVASRSQTDPIEQQFTALEAETNVDLELKRLKAQLDNDIP